MFKAAAALLAIIVAVTYVTAAGIHGRPSTPNRHTISNVKLPNGRTLTRGRGRFVANNNKAVGGRGGEATATDPPIEQAKTMMFVITDYCNNSMDLVSGSVAIDNGGWVVPPPQKMCSFKECEITGFEAKVEPGQMEPAMNGTFSYKMQGYPYAMQCAFALVKGEWEFEFSWEDKWRAQLMVSEYDHVAIYNVGLGNLRFAQSTWC